MSATTNLPKPFVYNSSKGSDDLTPLWWGSFIPNLVRHISSFRVKSTPKISYIHYFREKIYFFYMFWAFQTRFREIFLRALAIFASTISLKALKILKWKFPPRLFWGWRIRKLWSWNPEFKLKPLKPVLKPLKSTFLD